MHHRLTRIIVGLADDNGIDLGHVSFTKVLKHSRRSVVRPCSDTPTKIKEFLVMLEPKVHRKLDNDIRRLQEADWRLKRPGSKYSSNLSYRINTRDRRPTLPRVPGWLQGRGGQPPVHHGSWRTGG
ncbi:hypothetical protein OK006_8187 [Actinobacteria bacterium OK006]|nr:hypothetical protein OK006_8187 [Actinobacteria bacterium OK006]